MQSTGRLALFLVISFCSLSGCNQSPPPAAEGETSLAILLVAHGSKSSRWNQMIKDVADNVRETALQQPGVKELQVAFITEAKPSIADEMRHFDQQGYDEVIIVPLFLSTVSSRINNYLVYLAGIKTEAKVLKSLKNEGFDLYYPRARVNMTSALNQSNVLKKNVLRRVQALQGQDSGDNMGVILVGYGDQQFSQQMEELMEGIGRYLKIKTDIDTVAFAFVGNLVDYSGEPLARVINETQKLVDNIIVIPVLLGVDDMLQLNTIQAAINAVEIQSRIRYKQDAVLPDENVNKWVIRKITEAARRINGPAAP